MSYCSALQADALKLVANDMIPSLGSYRQGLIHVSGYPCADSL